MKNSKVSNIFTEAFDRTVMMSDNFGIKARSRRLAGDVFYWNNDISLSFCVLFEVFSDKCHVFVFNIQ